MIDKLYVVTLNSTRLNIFNMSVILFSDKSKAKNFILDEGFCRGTDSDRYYRKDSVDTYMEIKEISVKDVSKALLSSGVISLDE